MRCDTCGVATQTSKKSGAKSENWWEPSIGDLLVLTGAIILLVSLFLNWWSGPTDEVSVSAWTALEVVDLILAALSVIAIILVLPASPGKVEFNKAGAAWLPWLGPIAILLIGASIIHDPPTVNGLSLAAGAWIGLGGAVVMSLGGFLRRVGISIAIASRS